MSALDGYFVAPDAFDADWLWRERGDYPEPVVSRHELRDDPDVWAVLVAATETDDAAEIADRDAELAACYTAITNLEQDVTRLAAELNTAQAQNEALKTQLMWRGGKW